MVVFGTKKIGEECGDILFSGSEEECIVFAYSLDFGLFRDVHICEDNGIIKWRLK